MFDVVRIEVICHAPDDDHTKGRVEVLCPIEARFIHLMMAAEYLSHIVASESNAGYECALELIAQGAIGFRDLEKPPERPLP